MSRFVEVGEAVGVAAGWRSARPIYLYRYVRFAIIAAVMSAAAPSSSCAVAVSWADRLASASTFSAMRSWMASGAASWNCHLPPMRRP